MHTTTAMLIVLALAATVLTGCAAGTYKSDLAFLEQHTDGFELYDSSGDGRIFVVPQYQGRVMTSTAVGPDGKSLGWINPAAIKIGDNGGAINAYGGEERFWIGPEGGQFSIFFKPGDTFDLDHWQTPALIDTEPFDLVDKSATRAVFKKASTLTNMSGTKFDFRVDRVITILEPKQIAERLKLPDGGKGLSMVGYETDNTLTNTGKQAWTEKTGMLSIWLLGQYPATPETTAVLPVRKGSDKDLGPRVNVYETFNKLGPDRLATVPGAVFYKADGQYRSKIGISPKRALPVLGSYDAANNILTIIHYNKPDNVTKYVKSTWEHQKYPFGGDVANSYNDGGSLGAFYELESSSPAAELKPGQNINHTSQTFHLTGPKAELDKVAREQLGVSLEEITSALP